MHHSLLVSVKTPKLQVLMLDFLQEFYSPWPELLELNDDPTFSMPTTKPLRPSGKCQIGFDYHLPSPTEKEYNLAIARWVAIQVGKTRKTFRLQENLVLERPVPYYIYDSYQLRPILLIDEWATEEKLGHCVYDRLGMPYSDQTARDLAWNFIDTSAYYEASMPGLTSHQIQSILLSSGMVAALDILNLIRVQVERLDGLWQAAL